MSTATATAPALPAGSTSLWNVVRSEWVKLWSVRSTVWTLGLVVVLTVGFGALICWAIVSSWDQAPPETRATIDATSISLAGLMFAQLAIAVLGAMIITTEYSTGGIRATFTAVPKRLKVLAAKAIVLAVAAFVTGVVTSFAAFYLGQAILSTRGISTSIGEPGVLRAVFGGGLYILGCGMLGFAIGALLRHTAGAITLAVALLFVAPILLSFLPSGWGDQVRKYFVSNAGQQITSATSAGSTDMLAPWPGYLVFTLWWVVILLVAAYFLNRRDA